MATTQSKYGRRFDEEFKPYADHLGVPLYHAAAGAIVLSGPGGGPADPVLAPSP